MGTLAAKTLPLTVVPDGCPHAHRHVNLRQIQECGLGWPCHATHRSFRDIGRCHRHHLDHPVQVTHLNDDADFAACMSSTPQSVRRCTQRRLPCALLMQPFDVLVRHRTVSEARSCSFIRLSIDRSVPEVFGSTYEIRMLLGATGRLRDGKEFGVPEPASLRDVLMNKFNETQIGALLREFGLVTSD
jgi:hypothetical protein